ncbi:hypothetical protein L204_103652 [Cryptococcus depauperatus]|nr:hypothetical protein L204_01969 [Cryptococcus depauperatus CBS 7855]
MDADPWADASSAPFKPSKPASPLKAPEDVDIVASTLSIDQVQGQTSSQGIHQDDMGNGNARDGVEKIVNVEESVEIRQAVGHDEFDDNGFDQVDEPLQLLDSPVNGAPSLLSDEEEDAFGDFGDFKEGDHEELEVENRESFDTITHLQQPTETNPERWHALELRPIPPRSEISDQLTTLLAPLLTGSEFLTDEPPRAVGGLSQILMSESSRTTYTQLITPPITKPLDWTRSCVRRKHLISLGVPVNLDEVDPLRINITNEASSSSFQRLPAKRADTYDGSTKPGHSDADEQGRRNGIGAMPIEDGRTAGAMGKYGLGRKPGMDMVKAGELCGIEEEQLSLLPILTLQKLQQDLVENSAQASGTLAWMLQLKDAQLQDHSTYNSMISSLIANAARAKTSSSSGGKVFRSTSNKRPQSTSGLVTPRRAGSPGIW